MSSPAPDYTVVVTDMDGTQIADDLQVSALSTSKTLNAAGSCEFMLPMDHPDCTLSTLSPMKRRVAVWRDAALIWGGDLVSASVEVANHSVRFLCNGYFDRLRFRQFEENLYYKKVEQFTIAWGLLEYTQSLNHGDLQITDGGAADSGTKRTRHYCAWQGGTVADALTDLSEADDGFDFEITPDLVWEVWSPRRGVTSPTKDFVMGNGPSDVTNVNELRMEIDGSEMANRIAGSPDDDCIDVSDFVIVGADNSLDEYGLLQDSIDLPNMKDRDDQRAFLREELRIRKTPRRQVTLTTQDTPFDTGDTFEVGDVVNLNADLGFVTYDPERFRVMSYTLTLEEGQESTSVLLDSVTT